MALHENILQSCQISIKFKVARQIFDKSTHLKFHEHPTGRSGCVPCERTDGPTDRKETVWTDRQTEMTKLTAAFRNLTNAHKKLSNGSS